jgi:CubicO group peptidase (beta-lactamase class C family)
MRPRRVWAIVLAILATTSAAASTTPSDDDARREIDSVFAQWDHWDSPGAAVVVVRDGEVFYQRGYGSAQLEYSVPITPQTVFHIASVSKQFTAMTIELLAQDGKLSWDDDVHRYLPELPDYGRPITLRQLANHTSGIRDQWELLLMAGWRFDDVITREHILRMVFRQRELNFPPGSQCLYCNSVYTLLAEFASRVAGKPFREVAAERIFLPLGMSRTRVHDDLEEIVPGRAYSYSPREGGGFRNSVLSYSNAGATSLFTTVEDLARWLRNFETGTVGGKAGLEHLATRGLLADGKTIDYALGISHGKYRGAAALSHGGSDAGFRTFLLWLPEHRTGVAVLANLSSFDAGASAQKVVDVLIGDRLGPLPPALAQPAPTPPAQPAEVPAAVLDEYVGHYQLIIGALVTIARRDGGLVMSQPLEEGEFALTPASETELWSNGAQLTFRREQGKPSPGFTVKVGGLNVPAKRIEPLPASSIGDLVGRYWSDALATGYELLLEGDQLIARHSRNRDVHLFALAPDQLVGDAWFFAKVAITRDSGGKVDGFRLSGDRARNIRFERR